MWRLIPGYSITNPMNNHVGPECRSGADDGRRVSLQRPLHPDVGLAHWRPRQNSIGSSENWDSGKPHYRNNRPDNRPRSDSGSKPREIPDKRPKPDLQCLQNRKGAEVRSYMRKRSALHYVQENMKVSFYRYKRFKSPPPSTISTYTTRTASRETSSVVSVTF